ncbi:MAG: ABC transporter permease subunit [Clostridiaceae bacterium]
MGALLKNEYIKLFSRTKTKVILGLLILSHLMVGFIYTKTGEPNRIQATELAGNQVIVLESTKANLEKELIDLKLDPEKVLTESLENLSPKGDIDPIGAVKFEYINVMERIGPAKEEYALFQTFKTEDDYNNYRYAERMKYRLQSESDNKGISKNQSEYFNLVNDVLKQNIDAKSPNFEVGKSSLGYLMFYSEFMGMTGFWIILLALLMADVVSTEYQPPTLKTLLTQNKSRTSILMSKIIVTLSMALLSFVVVTAVAFIIASALLGPGHLDHKMIFNQQFKIVMQDGMPVREAILGTGSIITMKQFLGYSFIQLVFFSFAMSGFMILFSTITRNTLLSLAFTVMIPFFIIIVAQFIAGTIPFADFNPFIYGNFKGFSFNDYTSVPLFVDQAWKTSFNFFKSMGILLGFGAVSYGLSLAYFKTKDQMV